MEKIDISKKYSLDSVPKGWDKYDFWWITDKLENASREELVRISELPQIQLRFSDSEWDSVPTQEIINALEADFVPEELIRAIVSVIYEKR